MRINSETSAVSVSYRNFEAPMYLFVHILYSNVQGVKRIAVRYFFKQGEMVRYGMMPEKYESESR